MQCSPEQNVAQAEQSQPNNHTALSTIDGFILTAVDRMQNVSEQLSDLSAQYPATPYLILMSEWWSGSRRTQPLAESHLVAYWHQLYDVVIPWISTLSLAALKPTGSSPPTPLNADTKNSRVERILANAALPKVHLNKSAMIVTCGRSNTDLWLELLESLNVHAVQCDVSQRFPEARFQTIVLDIPQCHAASAQINLQNVIDCVRRCRRQFPSALIIVCQSFPRWSEWQECMQAGANWLLPKPFSVAGLSRSMQIVFDQAPQKM